MKIEEREGRKKSKGGEGWREGDIEEGKYLRLWFLPTNAIQINVLKNKRKTYSSLTIELKWL